MSVYDSCREIPPPMYPLMLLAELLDVRVPMEVDEVKVLDLPCE